MKKLLLMVAVVSVIIFCCCSRRVYVPVEKQMVMRDTVRIVARSADSVVSRDSVMIERAGDTVRIREVRMLREVSLVRDTVHHWRSDTVIVERPAVIPVRQPESNSRSSRWKWLSLGVVLIAGVLLLVRLRSARN